MVFELNRLVETRHERKAFYEHELPSKTLKTMELPRLSGSGGLASAVSAALESGAASRTLLVFDFDRTLTNGISIPGEEETAKVVRGGEATVAALRRGHEAGAGLFIITARRPAPFWP